MWEKQNDEAATGRGLLFLTALGVALIGLSAWASTVAHKPTYDWYVIAAVASAVPFVAAVLLVWRWVGAGGQHASGGARSATVLWIILAVAAILRVIAFASPHDGLTTDAYRYVWDGRIQWAGFNPYLHVPASPELEHLRDEDIYPHINQKEKAVTVYPPFAQILFAAGNWLSDSVLGAKIIMAFADLVIIGGLFWWLSAAGLPRERIILYAWHPLPIWELVSQAHIDAPATALLVLGLAAVWRGRQGLAGGIFAAAVLTKYFPLALIPAVWRRWDWRMPTAFIVVAAALTLPYWLAGQPDLSGYLSKHLDNEGYQSGWGFHPIWMLRDFQLGDPPGRYWVILSLLVLAALGAWSFWGRPRDAYQPQQFVVIAAMFVWLTSPHYPWYFVWIVPLLCVYLSPAAFTMTLMAPILYWTRPPGGATWTELYAFVFYLPVLVLFVEIWWRRTHALRADLSFQVDKLDRERMFGR